MRATTVVFILAVAAWLTAAAVAQPAVEPAGRSLAAPGAEQLRRAFDYVEGAVRAAGRREGGAGSADVENGLNELAGDGPPDIGAAGVCVTLRLDGEEVAREWSIGGLQDLKAATDRAVVRAGDGLPAARDVLQRRARAEAWEKVKVSVELAGALVPLDLVKFAEADLRVLPGIEGVGVRTADRMEVVFPAQMLIANDSPAAALVGLVSRVSGDPTLAMPGVDDHEAGAIARLRGISFFKFRASHVAQTFEGGPPMILHRGARVVTSREIDLEPMRLFARQLSENLLAQRTVVDGREEVFASYFPLQGRSGDLGGAREKALVCVALCEGARVGATPDPTQPRPLAVEAAQEILIPMLSIQGRLPDAEVYPASAAALVVAMSELFAWTGRPRGDWFGPQRDRLAAAVRSALDENGNWRGGPQGESGLIAHALACLAVDPVMGEGNQAGMPAGAARDEARAALQALYRNAGSGLVSHMPWVGRAEVLLAGDGDIQAAAALRQVRDQAWATQWKAEAAAARGGDMEGGLALGGVVVDGSPTVHSARALAFFAQALGDSRLTDASERTTQLLRLLAGLRFLRQLAVDESMEWCVPDPGRARWGVRAAVFDQRQSVEGTAMTLMTVSSAVRSIEQLDREKAPK